MTIIEFIKKKNCIVKYSAIGHADYSEHGTDIVCASISSILQFPLAGITELLNIVPVFHIDDGDFEIDLRNVNLQNRDHEVNILLNTMFIMLKELENEYPKYLKLVEKEAK